MPSHDPSSFNLFLSVSFKGSLVRMSFLAWSYVVNGNTLLPSCRFCFVVC